MVNDVAFVGFELRRALTKRGIKVTHLFFEGYPRQKGRYFEALRMTLKMAWKLRKARCNLVHAHGARYAAYAGYLSGKPYVVHCHGSDIRSGINWLERKCLNKAKKVLVSTRDLLEVLPDAIWLPNPVDMERFKPLREHDGNKVLYYPKWYENISNELMNLCEKLGYELRIQRKKIPYKRMHEFLNRFDIYVDRYAIKSYSKTALEAMACGLAVIGYEHNLKETLSSLRDVKERRKYISQQRKSILPDHDPRQVASRLIEIYRQVIA